MQERLGLDLARYDAGEVTSEINVISSALHGLRGRSSTSCRPTARRRSANIAARLTAVPDRARRSTSATLLRGGRARATSRRATRCSRSPSSATSGPTRTATTSSTGWPTGVDGRRRAARRAASAARRPPPRRPPSSAAFLREELAPLGREKQAAGRERYELASQYFLGATVDLDETYAWGFEELARLETEMRAVAAEIVGPARVDRRRGRRARRRPGPHGSPARRRSATGCRRWPTRRSPSCTAPTSTSPSRSGGSSAASRRPATAASTTPARARTSPARAGCGGRCRRASTEFSTWREVTTVYHEGVPGHHLQVGADRGPRRAAQPLAAAAVLVLRPRRGLGALRRAADGRPRLPATTRATSSACSTRRRSGPPG